MCFSIFHKISCKGMLDEVTLPVLKKMGVNKADSEAIIALLDAEHAKQVLIEQSEMPAERTPEEIKRMQWLSLVGFLFFLVFMWLVLDVVFVRFGAGDAVIDMAKSRVKGSNK